MPAARRSAAGRVVPDVVEQLVLGTQSAGERVDEPALALEPVRDVLVELGGGIGHGRAVPRAQDIERERAQPAQRGQIAGQRARAGRHEDAAGPQHRIAGEAHRPRHEREVVGRVPGRRDRRERPEASPSPSTTSRAGAAAATGAGPAAASSASTASVWSRCEWVSATPPSPPRAPTSAATASTCPAARGPGSTTHAGPRPSTHVFVPSSVNAPGFSARTRATSCALQRVRHPADATGRRSGTRARSARPRRRARGSPHRTRRGFPPAAR